REQSGGGGRRRDQNRGNDPPERKAGGDLVRSLQPATQTSERCLGRAGAGYRSITPRYWRIICDGHEMPVASRRVGVWRELIMRVCPHCQGKIDDDATYSQCYHCGGGLGTVTELAHETLGASHPENPHAGEETLELAERVI